MTRRSRRCGSCRAGSDQLRAQAVRARLYPGTQAIARPVLKPRVVASGSDDPRLFPSYLGYPSVVRGYELQSLDSVDCPPTTTNTCPALNRLVGSRTLVGNLEFRFPLLRPLGESPRMYGGPVPLELGFFADGGVEWWREAVVSGRSPRGCVERWRRIARQFSWVRRR